MDDETASCTKGLGLEESLISWNLFGQTKVKPVSSIKDEYEDISEHRKKSFFKDHSQVSAQNSTFKSNLENQLSSPVAAFKMSFFESYAYRSFPREVQLCLSSIPGNNFGVMARTAIPQGVLIGPYEGKLIDVADQNYQHGNRSNMWEIIYKNHFNFLIDGSDISTASWMRFIQSARNKMEQNASAFQYQGHIYYRLVRDIAPGEEILVWYDESYPQYLGIPVMDLTFLKAYREPTSILKRNIIKTHNDPQEKEVELGKRPSSGHEVLGCDNEAEPESKVLRGIDDTSSNVVENGGLLKQSTSSLSSNSESSCHGNSNSPSSLERCSDCHPENSSSHSGSSPDRCDNSPSQFYKPISQHSNSHERIGNNDSPCQNGSSPDNNNNNNISQGCDEFTPLECAQCNKTFAQRATLQMHLCPKQTNAPYHCGYCTLSFTNPSDLRSHVVHHVREKPFKCGFCARSFVGATTLNNHIRVHTGRKLIVG